MDCFRHVAFFVLLLLSFFSEKFLPTVRWNDPSVCAEGVEVDASVAVTSRLLKVYAWRSGCQYVPLIFL